MVGRHAVDPGHPQSSTGELQSAFLWVKFMQSTGFAPKSQEIEWRDIPGYPGYQATKCGQIRSIPREWHTGWGRRTHDGVVMSKTLDKSTGYLRVKLRLNGGAAMRYAHRLVALAWIDNPHLHPMINHIDGDRTNCAIENLEWCTALHNVRHGIARRKSCNQ